jgi:hypothetical protein
MSSTTQEFRATAEAHWQFIDRLLDTCAAETVTKGITKGTLHYLYVEAMIHGYKHAQEMQR